MKKDLYIFRHGETDYNLEHRWQGCGLDAVLNENGEEQARKLAEKVLSLGMTVYIVRRLSELYKQQTKLPAEVRRSFRLLFFRICAKATSAKLKE